MTEQRRVPRELPCDLTDEEKLAVGEKLAAVGIEIEQCNERSRKIAADKRPKVKLALELTRKLHAGAEVRTVLCDVVEGPGVNIRFVRVDTGETVEQRAMLPEERQAKMAGGDWFAETQKAVERAQGGGGGDEGGAEDDEPEDDGKVVPFGGRTTTKKAARSPRKPGGKGKGRKR